MNANVTTTPASCVTDASHMLRKLQKADKKQAVLYLFCNFVSLLLITAYSAMMFSPTVLLVLPEGGDSRKQMVMIFVLALFGCVVFTIYASGLFFRKKARQLGTLMALGASKKWLAPGLFQEVLLLSGSSSLLGIIAGFPFVYLLWNSFRLFIVDSQEMKLTLDFRCLYLSAAFFVIVVAFSCVTAYRYLRRTDLMDVVHEEHKNEPVKELGRWCGPVGILLLFAGAILGYLAPTVYYNLCDGYYPPAWLNLFYVPAFVGLYMIMLHTVVSGWRSHRKHPYKDIIARSMMKFQGRQTVNNLLVSTVLIAGASFAIFYIPMMSAGQLIDIKNRPFAYSYRYPLTQDIPGKEEVTELAADFCLTPIDWRECSYAVLAVDGMVDIEDEGNSYHREYRELCSEGRFFSESAYNALTGSSLSVGNGTYYAINNEEETNLYSDTSATLLTNMATRQSIPTAFAGFAHYNYLSGSISYYVISDNDYAEITEGLTLDWMEEIAFFNMDGEDNYTFAQKFFYTLVDSFDPECAIGTYYDRVSKTYCEEHGEVYWGDTEAMTQLSFSQPDSTEFRAYWLYMPKITELDRTDFVRTYAVFLMMFLFISIICILAAIIISYTRCMTIALNNRYVFDDLMRLGASPTFLLKEVKSQSTKVFAIPAGVGMSAMYFLYMLLMFGNDGKLSFGEIVGLAGCLGLLLVLGALFYLVYRYTVKKMAKELGITV